ncbi:FHA domain-containing protein [Rosistilla oblonga]|uniref:FHA domain-containing protein n=1 Tax=Rosistilla oblonga TaxID=2527990 RepID=UPI003A97AB45
MSAPANTQKPTQNQDPEGPRTEDYLEFQVDRVGHPRRRLRLSGQSYTFGSGEGCSVRLEDPSLRKTHAILIRQQDRLLIRGYGIAILVNGIRVTEAWLEERDNVQLGDYTLTLLQGVPKSNNPSAPSPQPTTAPAEKLHSPFAETARHFISPQRDAAESRPLSRSHRKDDSTGSSRLSFADGMRMVSKPSVQFDVEDYFSRSTPLASPRPQAAAEPRGIDPREAARLQKLEEMQRQSARNAEAAIASSAASTHAVETLADKLDSLFEQLADNSERQRSDALQQQLESANEKHAKQLEAFVQLTDRVSVLETAVDRANREARQHREKHEQALQRIHQLEAQLSETITAHSERQASWEQETEGLRKAIDDLNRQLSIAQEELAQQQKTALSWRKQLDDAHTKADKTSAEHAAAIAAQIQRQEELAAEHARAVDELSKQHALQNEALIAEHQQTVDDLRSEQEQLKANLAEELAEREAAMAREQAEHQQTLAFHAEQNEAAAAKIANLENELADSVANHKNHQLVWEAEAKELNAAIEQISCQLAIAENKFNDQRERAEQLQGELASVESAQADSDADATQRTAELHQELQDAQDRLAALRVEQAARQSSWQLEREELEYKISHQAAELSQFTALRPAVNPQEEATVANRLAARLQAEVNRLHQDQPSEGVDQTQQLAQSRETQPETDPAPFAATDASDDLQSDASAAENLHDEQPSSDAPAFQIGETDVEPEGQFDTGDADEEPSAPAVLWSNDDLTPEDTYDDALPIPSPQAFTDTTTNTDTQPSVDWADDAQSMAQSDAQSEAWNDDSDEQDISSTCVMPPSQQPGGEASLPPANDGAFGLVPPASESTDDVHSNEYRETDGSDADETVSENSFGSYDEAGWDDGANGLVIDSSNEDEVSPWGENDDEALSGLAAEMIGEFNRDDPQAGSFADLSESSTYDPTSMDLDESMSMGFSFPIDAKHADAEDSDQAEQSDPIAQAFPSIAAPSDLDASDDQDNDDDAAYTQVMPEGGFGSMVSPEEPAIDDYDHTPQSHDEPVDSHQVASEPEAEYHNPQEESQEEESYYGAYADEDSDDGASAIVSPVPQELPRRDVPQHEPAPSESALVSPASDHHGDDADEDSIEAYMNRLLKRMHGGADEPEPEAPPQPQPAASQPTQAVAATPIEATMVEEAPQDVMHESEYVPRSSAPEHSGNLSAMRELANSSARQAIAKSVRNRQRSQAMLKLFLSGAFIMGSGTFAVLAQRQLMPYSLAAGACVLLAVYWGLSGLKLLKGSGPSSDREPSPVQRPAAPAVVDEQPTTSVDQ